MKQRPETKIEVEWDADDHVVIPLHQHIATARRWSDFTPDIFFQFEQEVMRLVAEAH